MEKNNILATVLHGSKLYRLDNPDSDTDKKSIFIPPIQECVFMRASRNKRSETGEGADKQENEAFCLQEFLKLAARGEDVAITTLHCQESDIFVDSPTFQFLRKNRKQFYTKRMAGMCGFSRSMAAKYSLRADRMAAVEGVIEWLKAAEAKRAVRLADHWDELKESEHVIKTVSPLDRNEDKRVVDVVGKLLPASISPSYGLEILTHLRDSYGARVKAAKNMDGVDRKSICHAFRTGYQLIHIFTDGDFSFPLPESQFLRDVKEGRLSYVEDKLDEKLDKVVAEAERLASISQYPDRVSQSWLDSIVLAAYGLT